MLAVGQSVVQDGRETDVEVLLDAGASGRLLVFVEDKITAAMQPFQLEDYQARGRRNVRRGRCSRFAVVLCAPADKMESRSTHVDGEL